MTTEIDQTVQCIISDLRALYDSLLDEANKSEPLSKSYYYFLDRASGVYSAINVIEGQKHWPRPDENIQ